MTLLAGLKPCATEEPVIAFLTCPSTNTNVEPAGIDSNS
jgi:hypothetical protein